MGGGPESRWVGRVYSLDGAGHGNLMPTWYNNVFIEVSLARNISAAYAHLQEH